MMRLCFIAIMTSLCVELISGFAWASPLLFQLSGTSLSLKFNLNSDYDLSQPLYFDGIPVAFNGLSPIPTYIEFSDPNAGDIQGIDFSYFDAKQKQSFLTYGPILFTRDNKGTHFHTGSFLLTDMDDQSLTFTISSVPLPAAAPMFGAALLALGAIAYSTKRKAAAA